MQLVFTSEPSDWLLKYNQWQRKLLLKPPIPHWCVPEQGWNILSVLWRITWQVGSNFNLYKVQMESIFFLNYFICLGLSSSSCFLFLTKKKNRLFLHRLSRYWLKGEKARTSISPVEEVPSQVSDQSQESILDTDWREASRNHYQAELRQRQSI